MTWNIHNGALINTYGQDSIRSKVAAFDMDGTLIKTMSGKRFARDVDDWRLFDDLRVPAKLKALYDEGYSLVIISNQLGVSKGKVSTADIQLKVDNIVSQLDLPFVAILATENNHMRKPRIGSWEYLEQLAGESAHQSSFYCGDAAGRPKDFAATDFQFALNIGIDFKTPEQLFLNRKPLYRDEWEFDPRTLARVSEPRAPVLPSTQEMVVLVGPPASGKSTIARQCCLDYVTINQDLLGTVARCKKACIEALKNGCSVLIDSTNRNVKTRAIWIEIAQKHKVAIRCILMRVEKPLALHINTYRAVYGDKVVPAIAIHTYYKGFEEPTVAEGFYQVIEQPFTMDTDHLSALEQSRMTGFL